MEHQPVDLQSNTVEGGGHEPAVVPQANCEIRVSEANELERGVGHSG